MWVIVSPVPIYSNQQSRWDHVPCYASVSHHPLKRQRRTIKSSHLTAIMTDLKVHSQAESRLLSAPLEVRREIYSYFSIDNQIHIFQREGKLRISTCLKPSLGDHVHDGRDRRNNRDKEGLSYRNPEWARRLASPWGPHWECEDNASRVNSGKELYHVYDLRSVCKKM